MVTVAESTGLSAQEISGALFAKSVTKAFAALAEVFAEIAKIVSKAVEAIVRLIDSVSIDPPRPYWQRTERRGSYLSRRRRI